MCAGARAVLCCAVLCCVCARAGECARVHMSARARLCLDMLRTLYIYMCMCVSVYILYAYLVFCVCGLSVCLCCVVVL